MVNQFKLNPFKNPFLSTDTYKMSHMMMYHSGVTEVYSYLEARKEPINLVFYGLQYYLMEYLVQPLTLHALHRWFRIYEHMLGPVPRQVEERMKALQKLGYWPIEICALPEGTLIASQNVLMTMRNTHPDFPWAVGYLESLLLKVWNTCTVATASLQYLELVEHYARFTCDNFGHVPYAVHDFGYRGVSSEETAALSGSAHLLCFRGSDTLLAVDMVWDYYTPTSSETIIGKSVPASEHSVMCSYSRENEFEAIDNIIFNVVPTGIVSVVSDSYDLWAVLTEYVRSRKDRILERPGTVVFRPDSGNPIDIICGTVRPSQQAGATKPEEKGCLNLLWEVFGGTINSQGYKVLNPKVGLIYGDGMHYDRFFGMLERMSSLNFASSNLVIGVGGLLLQQHNRDEHGYAIKAVNVIRDGESVEIYKDPITDQTKKSKKGFLNLNFDGKIFTTTDQCKDRNCDALIPVFRDGELLRTYSIEDVRANLERSRRFGVEEVLES